MHFKGHIYCPIDRDIAESPTTETIYLFNYLIEKKDVSNIVFIGAFPYTQTHVRIQY